MGIYDNVVEVARAKGTNISRIEKKAGLSNGTIGKWKDGTITPRLVTLQKISAVLDVSVNRLIKENGKEH